MGANEWRQHGPGRSTRSTVYSQFYAVHKRTSQTLPRVDYSKGRWLGKASWQLRLAADPGQMSADRGARHFGARLGTKFIHGHLRKDDQ